MGHGAAVPTIRNTASIRSNARHRGGLVTSARRSLVDLVVVGDFTAWPPAASGHSRYDESGEETKSHREDSRSHGAKATDRCPRSLGGNDHLFQHMSRRGWSHGHDSVSGTTILKEQRNERCPRSGQFNRSDDFAVRWRFNGIRHSLDVQSTWRVAY